MQRQRRKARPHTRQRPGAQGESSRGLGGIGIGLKIGLAFVAVPLLVLFLSSGGRSRSRADVASATVGLERDLAFKPGGHEVGGDRPTSLDSDLLPAVSTRDATENVASKREEGDRESRESPAGLKVEGSFTAGGKGRGNKSSALDVPSNRATSYGSFVQQKEVLLKSIELGFNRKLHPAFKPRTYAYNTTVPKMIDSITVAVEALGSGSMTAVNGEVSKIVQTLSLSSRLTLPLAISVVCLCVTR